MAARRGAIPINISITGTETHVDSAHGFKDYTVYKLEIERGKQKYTVLKRFSQFAVLDMRLCNSMKRDLPKLPSRKRFHKRMDPELIRDRMKDLETYIQYVASLPAAVEHPAFQLFLEAKPTEQEKLMTKLEELIDSLKIEEKAREGLDTLIDMYNKQGTSGEAVEKVIQERKELGTRVAKLEAEQSVCVKELQEMCGGTVIAVALYDYDSQSDGEVSIREGDSIRVLDMQTAAEGWWKCEVVDGEIGLVPANYVKVLETMPVSTGKKVKALYEYSATHDDDLSLAVGDVIEIEGDAEDGWLRGRVRGTDRYGMFPADYVADEESISVEKGEVAEEEGVVWQKDTDVRDCNLCSKKFTPMFRRHHCRKCGLVFCKGCSKNKAMVDDRNVRVCDKCYAELCEDE